MATDYYAYLESKEWKQRAKEAKRRAGYKCQQCGKVWNEHKLHAHHKTYARLGYEAEGDLVILCVNCHADEHGIAHKRELTHAEKMEALRKA